MEAFFLAGARRARRALEEAEARAGIDESTLSVETIEEVNFEPHRNYCGTTVGHNSQKRRRGLCTPKNNPSSTVRCKEHAGGNGVEANRQAGLRDRGRGVKAPVESKKEGGDDKEEEEDEEVEEDPTVVACKNASARALLHLALWSQMARGNFDMDLRR